MNYINKNTGDLISQETYNQLSSAAKANYIASPAVNQTTHHITESKNLSVGDAIGVAVLTPLLIIDSFLP